MWPRQPLMGSLNLSTSRSVNGALRSRANRTGFEGTPVADARSLYVALTDRREQTATYVACLDADNTGPLPLNLTGFWLSRDRVPADADPASVPGGGSRLANDLPDVETIRAGDVDLRISET